MTRLALLVLPVLACFGALLPGFGQLFAFRLAVLAVAFAATLTLMTSRVQSKLLASFCVFALIWVLDAALLLGLTTKFMDGLFEILAILAGLILVLSLMVTTSASRHGHGVLRWLAQGWLVAYLVCAAVAVWELLTSRHLRNYVSPSYVVNPGHYPDIASVMGNPNQYGFFLSASFSFVLYLYVCSTKRFIRILLGIAALSSFYFMYAANCRFGLVCLAVQSLLWSRVYRREIFRIFKLAIGLSLLGFACIILFGLAVPEAFFRQGNIVGSVVGAFRDFTQPGSSTNVRVNLFLDGIVLMTRSRFIGIGPGGYVEALRRGEGPFSTHGIYSPHSAVAEIGSEYGLLILVLFWLVLVRWYWSARQINRVATDEATRRPANVVTIGLISLFLASWLNSEFLKPSISWMLVASLAVFAVYCERVVGERKPGFGEFGLPDLRRVRGVDVEVAENGRR